MKKRNTFVNQLFEENANLRKMIDDASNAGAYGRANASYQKITAELLLFIYLILRRLFFLLSIFAGLLIGHVLFG